MELNTAEQTAVVTLSESAATKLRGIMEEKQLTGTHKSDRSHVVL